MKRITHRIIEISETDNEEVAYDIPDCVQGVITFQNDFMQIPFVQGNDNTFYLTHNMDGEIDSRGIPFMDYRNLLQDQVITIYGHHVFNDDTDMFSPLVQLLDHSTYLQQNVFSITTRNDEKWYQITHIFLCENSSNFSPFVQGSLYDDELENWLAYPQEHNYVSCDDKITTSDHLVVLQTCYDLSGKTKLFVIAKQIDDKSTSF